MKLLEKHIEAAFKNFLSNEDGYEFIGQQVHVRCGIMDLLYYWEKWNRPVIVEVKRGRAPKNSLAQLSAYMGCVDALISDDLLIAERYYDGRRDGVPLGILVAESYDDMTKRALFNHPDVIYYRYEIRNDEIRFISYVRDLMDEYDKSKSEYYESKELTALVCKVRKNLVNSQSKKERELVDNPGGKLGALFELEGFTGNLDVYRI